MGNSNKLKLEPPFIKDARIPFEASGASAEILAIGKQNFSIVPFFHPDGRLMVSVGADIFLQNSRATSAPRTGFDFSPAHLLITRRWRVRNLEDNRK